MPALFIPSLPPISFPALEPRNFRINPHVGWVNEPDCGRGTLDILQSTLLTTFFCTYTSLHLNIPAPHTPMLSRLKTHLGWMTATMLAPELCTCVAMTQFLEALIVLRKLDNLYERNQYHPRHWHCWKLVNAFHYNMRGFVVRSKWPRPRILKMKHLEAIVERDWLRLITKSPDAIKDLSKNDSLAKTVALVQAFWLVAQVIGRIVNRLPVSPLEISAVAYVACTAFTYLLWLEKPQDVNTAEVVDPRFGELFRSPPASLEPAGGWKEQLPNLNRGLEGWQKVVMAFTFLGIASLFGGLHCLAWNYEFPTYEEQILWRISCIGMIALPPLFYTTRLVWETSDTAYYPTNIPDFISLALMIVYVLFRSFNMLEIFFCLRSAPEGLYRSVQWTEVLPHW